MKTSAFLSLLAFFPLSAFAGKATAPAEPGGAEGSWSIRSSSSYVGESDFIRGRDASGDAWSNILDISYGIPLGMDWMRGPDAGWLLRLGVGYERSDFGNKGGLPIPNHLQGAYGIVSLEYVVKGRRALFFEARPGAYFESDITSDSINVPLKIAGAYPLADNFYLVAGVTYSGFRSIPFIPALGFLWNVNDRWTVSIMPPDPRIIYRASEELELWVGGEVAGGSYRVDKRQGNSDLARRLNEAVVTYSEWRLGGGFKWSRGQSVLEIGAGYAFDRKFDFHRAEEGFETDEGAPYVQVELRTAF